MLKNPAISEKKIVFYLSKNSLRKQWAGLMYESITKNKNISINLVNKIVKKIEKLENQLKILGKSQVNSKSSDTKKTFNIKELTKELNTEEFSEIKEKIHERLEDLLMTDAPYQYRDSVIVIYNKVKKKDVERWLDSLRKTLKKYKWSCSISSDIVFKGLNVAYHPDSINGELNYDLILNFYSLYQRVVNNFGEEDISRLDLVIKDKINQYCYRGFNNNDEYEQDEEIPF